MEDELHVVPEAGVPDLFDERPNPLTTGLRYFLSPSGATIRNQWPLPAGATQASVMYKDESASGCRKKRFQFVGNRQRSSIWIMVCMRHETIIGFHIMPFGEGCRDLIYPLYRFKEKPPSQIWCDFACGCSETAQNYLPEYFTDTAWYHDVFHGYTHLCPSVFESKDMPFYSALNTSIMEQINSFLQPLRGILKSGTTKLATAMVWLEAFAMDWNERKYRASSRDDHGA